jgi:hypothetical protein
VRRVTVGNASLALSATLAMFLPVIAIGACGAPPAPSPPSNHAAAPAAALGKRRADIPDDCAAEPGKAPPEALRIQYTGVAKAAGCQRAVYTIMGGLTHFLGVQCRHCHLEPDYAADTHNKQLANWMARELVPRLQRRVADASGSRDVWCQDCHAGKARLLGDPRRRDFAIEWMTTHLVEDFDTVAGRSPKCRDCHGGDLGSSEFHAKVILSDLPGLPTPVAPVAAPVAVQPPAVAEPPALAPTPPNAAPALSAAPPAAIPDFGKR